MDNSLDILKNMVDNMIEVEYDNQLLKSVMLDIIGGLAYLNTEGKYIFANDYYCDSFGYTEEELINSVYIKRVHEDDFALLTQAYWEICGPFLFNLIFISMKALIKQLLRETLITEIRVINPNHTYNKGKFSSMEDEPPLHDNETIRVYHGFNKYEDAVMAAKFGFSGEEKARRIYSYESNNNPNGLFVTLDYKTAEKFSYPSGSRGIKVVLELSVKVADLEAPVWAGGTYTVQGQMAQYWKDAEDRNINGTLKARGEASQSKIPFVRDSDRPEVANALIDYERQALFIGNINPNMIKSVFFGESGKYGYNPKTMERISRQEFLNKFETHEPEKNSGGSLTDKGEQYHRRKDRIFKPNDDFNMEIFNKECIENEWDETGIEMLKQLQRYRYLDNFFWPKQIKQINDLLENHK